jgi:tRNA U34 5-methylaminomethyl-2-thiouridine-forming methyltransferase MnmC
MDETSGYEIVQLRNGAHSVRSLAHGETMHVGMGPAAEAHALYVEQADLAARLRGHTGEFVVWDVGLGAAANALAVFRATQGSGTTLRMLSFDNTLEPLQLALANADKLGYFDGYQSAVSELMENGRARIEGVAQQVNWDLITGDFSLLLADEGAASWPKPHLILYDAWSPAKNPSMWTGQVFASLFARLDPERACVLPTYSRSTMLRVALLLAGFYVGAGSASGAKEETTIAANARALIASPLDARWLERARCSPAAEPLWTAEYRQAPLREETWEKLRVHPQFAD